MLCHIILYYYILLYRHPATEADRSRGLGQGVDAAMRVAVTGAGGQTGAPPPRQHTCLFDVLHG